MSKDRDHWQSVFPSIFQSRFPELFKQSGELGAEYQKALAVHLQKFDDAAAAPHVPTVHEVSAMYLDSRTAEKG
jgi:hypothetical protein